MSDFLHKAVYGKRLLSVDTVFDFCNMCYGMAMKWITRDPLMDLMVLTSEQFHNLYLYHYSVSPSVCVCVCVIPHTPPKPNKIQT